MNRERLMDIESHVDKYVVFLGNGLDLTSEQSQPTLWCCCCDVAMTFSAETSKSRQFRSNVGAIRRRSIGTSRNYHHPLNQETMEVYWAHAWMRASCVGKGSRGVRREKSAPISSPRFVNSVFLKQIRMGGRVGKPKKIVVLSTIWIKKQKKKDLRVFSIFLREKMSFHCGTYLFISS